MTNKLWLVARREYLYNVRRPSFLIGAFGVPLFIFILWGVIFFLIDSQENNVERLGTVGYVDLAGVLTDTSAQPDYMTPYPDEDTARAALEADTIGAYVVIPENYLSNGRLRAYAQGTIPERLSNDLEDFLLANLTMQAGETLLSSERLQDPVNLSVRSLDSGRELRGDNAFVGLFLLPFGFVFLFIMATQTTSGFLMSGVVEEKTNRMMEILVTSVKPIDLLFGKVLGLGALGLTQFAIWLGTGLVVLTLGQNTEFLRGVGLPIDLIVVALTYFLLEYLLLSSLLGGLGAVAGSEQESRQYAGWMSIIFFLPFYLIIPFIQDANGPLPTALSMFPLTAPTAMLMRLALGAPPFWQIALSLALLLVTMLGVVWASARVFRWSILMYGKKISLRELWHVVRSDSEVGTTMATSTEGAK